LASTEKRLETKNIKDLKFNAMPKPKAENNGRLPDFRGQSMREVLTWGSSQGLEVVLEGSGLAVKQVPSPGSSLEKMTSIKVSFRPPA
jgi:hypothetical protein